MNVAEDATRCISFNKFGRNSSWFTGANFLPISTLNYFSEKIISTKYIPETAIEVNMINNNMMISDMNKCIFNWKYYSDLDKIIKHLQWILKLKSNWLNWKRNRKQRVNLKYRTRAN